MQAKANILSKRALNPLDVEQPLFQEIANRNIERGGNCEFHTSVTGLEGSLLTRKFGHAVNLFQKCGGIFSDIAFQKIRVQVGFKLV